MVDKAKQNFPVSLCHGDPHEIDWNEIGGQSLQSQGIPILVAKLGRYQDEPELDENAIDVGFRFEFIDEKGPRHNEGRKQMRWITKNVHPTSGSPAPIGGWQWLKIEKTLAQFAAAGSYAKAQKLC